MFEVRQRYSVIRNWQKMVKEAHKQNSQNCKVITDFPKMPPKKWWPNSDEEFIAQRHKDLALFLNAFLNKEGIQDHLIIAFLGLALTSEEQFLKLAIIFEDLFPDEAEATAH